jgi:hypothetical protein
MEGYFLSTPVLDKWMKKLSMTFGDFKKSAYGIQKKYTSLSLRNDETVISVFGNVINEWNEELLNVYGSEAYSQVNAHLEKNFPQNKILPFTFNDTLDFSIVFGSRLTRDKLLEMKLKELMMKYYTLVKGPDEWKGGKRKKRQTRKKN